MNRFMDILKPPKVEVDDKFITRHYLEDDKQYRVASASSTSLQRNKNKPCTKCDQPRHISANGRCNTTLCTAHSTKANQRHKKREKYIESL